LSGAPGVPGEVWVVPDVPEAFAALVAQEHPTLVALSGGTTAEQCYEAVDDLPGATVLLGDERWVPVDHPDSNEGMVRRVLVDRSTVACFHSMRGAGDDIEEAARNYDALLRALPPVDLIHLGLGPDGHTASLFPGSPALDERDRLVVATGDDRHPHLRLTFTFPAIAACRLVVVTVAGREKAEAWRAVRAGEDVPAARIRGDRVLWIVGDEV
jgi:6-phosphogluconolactonase